MAEIRKEMGTNTKYKYRFLARIVVEATTPLTIGSGRSNIMTDSLVTTDVNGLPYIPGTSLAGILKHSFDEADGDRYFGF